ncbi:MAG: sugar transferase [Lachnospiraceae bacterium]|nr:sugar transferase [Lachnospiraceae bacterium]
MKLYRKKYKLIEIYGAFLMDLLAIAISYFLAHRLRILLPFGARITEETAWFPIYVLCIIGCLLCNLMMNRYEGFFRRGYFAELEEVFRYNFIQFAFLSTCVYLFRLELDFSRLMLVYFVICNFVITYLLRVLFRKFIRQTYKKGKGSEKVLIVTDRQHLPSVEKHFGEDRGWSYEVVGIALTDLEKIESKKEKKERRIAKLGKEEVTIVAGRADLIDISRQMPIDLVFFYSNDTVGNVESWIQAFTAMGVKCYFCVQNLNFQILCSGVGEFADFPVMCYNSIERDYRMSIVKRLMDIAGSVVGLLITAVLFPFIAALIKIEDPKGKIFFSQIRIGKNGRRFRLYKFRSMYADAEERKKELLAKNEMNGPMFKLENDPRITKIGRILRKTSLDELPQFWNVFRGDMSLVGTRPPTEEEFEQYNDYYRRRMSITPGLTGLWQVSGRSNIKDFNEVVKLDLQYIDHWSIWKDLKILIQTVGVVFGNKGAE